MQRSACPTRCSPAWFTALAVTVFTMSGLSAVRGAETAGPLRITHSPAPFAVKGQPITLRARVAGGVGGVSNVTLFYALFRDAAPFRVAMTPSGMDMYVGTIGAGLLSGLASISYYIEAQDSEGSLEETAWYDVQFKDPAAPSAVLPPAGNSSVKSVAPTTGAPADGGRKSSAVTVGLIAGGAVALGAGAYFISDSGGDGGGGDSNTNKVGDAAGTYSGTVNLCRTPAEGDSEECDNSMAEIEISENGQVFSDSLFEGLAMTGNLSGNQFTLSSPFSDPGQDFSGNIKFNGAVINDSGIAGSISGTYTEGGVNGTFSGSFNLSK